MFYVAPQGKDRCHTLVELPVPWILITARSSTPDEVGIASNVHFTSPPGILIFVIEVDVQKLKCVEKPSHPRLCACLTSLP